MPSRDTNTLGGAGNAKGLGASALRPRSVAPSALGGGTLSAPPSRRQQIVELLREAIVHRKLLPGEQVRQEYLCEAFGVSPTPVREALRQLESEGLLAHYPNRGVFVTDVSSDELFGVLLPVRLTIEQYALTNRPITEATLTELAQIVEVMEEAAQRKDFVSATDADLRFHEVCVLQAQANHVTGLWRAVHSLVRLHLHGLSSKLPVEDIPIQHRELLDVLRTQNRLEICAALDEHVVASAKALLYNEESES